MFGDNLLSFGMNRYIYLQLQWCQGVVGLDGRCTECTTVTQEGLQGSPLGFRLSCGDMFKNDIVFEVTVESFCVNPNHNLSLALTKCYESPNITIKSLIVL